MKVLGEIFISFFKIGLFTLGGGYAMLPLIQKEVVEKKKWIDEKEFLDMVSVSQSAPGPLAVNISVFVGYRISGIKGLISAVLGATLPSFIIIILIASVFIGIENNPIIERIFKGIRPAVVALIAVPVLTMGKTANVNRRNIIIPVLAIILVAGFKITPIYVILGAIIIGIVEIKRRNKNDIT